MLNIEKTRRLTELHEGRKNHPYVCPAGYLTIGVGRNLEGKGLKDYEIDYLHMNDVMECVEDLRTWPWFDPLDEVRQAALVDMRFMGPAAFRTFKQMLAAFGRGDFEEAAKQAQDSRWYHQVGDRGPRIVRMIRTGKWPNEL